MQECLAWADESFPQGQKNAFEQSATLDYDVWGNSEGFLTTCEDDHMYEIDGEWFNRAPTSMRSHLTELVDPPAHGSLDTEDVAEEAEHDSAAEAKEDAF